MSFLHPFTKSSESVTTVPMTYEAQSLTLAAPESVGNILGKVGLIWAGLFAGLKLGDVVLMATLVYTVLQIGLTVYERIVRPITASRRIRVAAKAAEAAAYKSSSTQEK